VRCFAALVLETVDHSNVQNFHCSAACIASLSSHACKFSSFAQWKRNATRGTKLQSARARACHYISSSPVSQASTSSTAPGLSGPVAYFDSVSWTWMIAFPGTAVTSFRHSSNSSRERTRKPRSMLGSSSAIPSLRTRRVWHDAMSSGDGSSGKAERVECGSR
jgi:hypothetical protein